MAARSAAWRAARQDRPAEAAKRAAAPVAGKRSLFGAYAAQSLRPRGHRAWERPVAPRRRLRAREEPARPSQERTRRAAWPYSPRIPPGRWRGREEGTAGEIRACGGG